VTGVTQGIGSVTIRQSTHIQRPTGLS